MDSQGRATPLTAEHLRGTNLTLAQLRATLARRYAAISGGGGAFDEEDEGEEDEEDDEYVDEDDDDEDDGSYWGPTRRNTKRWYPVIKDPVKEGVELLRGGDFGPPPRKYRALGGAEGGARRFRDGLSSNVSEMLDARQRGYGRTDKRELGGEGQVPRGGGVEVAQFQSKVYSGSYSSDGSFFYAAAQDYRSVL